MKIENKKKKMEEMYSAFHLVSYHILLGSISGARVIYYRTDTWTYGQICVSLKFLCAVFTNKDCLHSLNKFTARLLNCFCQVIL